MSTATTFNKSILLAYLGLPADYEPDPETATIPFLAAHLTQLPPHLLSHFSQIISPKDRTTIPTIRNRRLRYTTGKPACLESEAAKSRWPHLWWGTERRGIREGKAEKEWGDHDFVKGTEKHVGRIGILLGEYEEEREAERARNLRRQEAEKTQTSTEEDEDRESGETDEDSELDLEENTTDDGGESFERLIRERFIYGLLEFEYDEVDWDDTLDTEGDREAEERWFDEEDAD